MGKQVTVAKVPAGVSLPNSGLYTLSNVVVLSDAQYQALPYWYLNNGYLTSISTVADPTPPVVQTNIAEITADVNTIGNTSFLPAVSPRNAFGPIPVASRTNHYYSGIFGSSSTQTFYTKHLALANITSLTLGYGNSYGTSAGGQGDGPGDLSVNCSVIVGSTIYRGRATAFSRPGTVNPGAIAEFLPIAVFIPKGTYFFIATYVSGNWPTGLTTNHARATGADTVGDGLADSLEGIASPSTNDTTLTGVKASSTQLAYSPLYILGTTRDTNVPCVVCIGDSIAQHSNESPDMGWFTRAVANQYPSVKLAQPGETAQQWAVNSTSLALVESRMRVLRYGTHFVFAHGRNDLTSSRTLAQIQGDLITSWNRAVGGGAVSFQVTITPRATSTDSFATLVNQTTTADNAVRLTLNAWLRDGAPMTAGSAVAVGTVGASRCPVYSVAGTLVTAASGPAGHLLAGGVLEIADIVESARDSGKWKADRTRTVTDGAITTATKVLTSATANFQPADLGTGVAITGAGSAGALLLGIISSIQSTTSVTISPTASTTVSGTNVLIGAASYDGVHPNGDRHRDIASQAIKPVLDAAIAAYRG